MPFRNAHFLSAATSWAEVLGARRIYIGAVQQDSSGYPDCRPEFYQAFNEAIRTGTKDGAIRIETPLIGLRKSEIVTLGLELGAPFDLTWSCYSRVDQACGSLRKLCAAVAGLCEAAGARDPIPYLSPASSQDCSEFRSQHDSQSSRARALAGLVSRRRQNIMKRFLSFHFSLTMLLGISAFRRWAQGSGTVKALPKIRMAKPSPTVPRSSWITCDRQKMTTKTGSQRRVQLRWACRREPTTPSLSTKTENASDAFGQSPGCCPERRRARQLRSSRRRGRPAGPTRGTEKERRSRQKANEKIKDLNGLLAQARDLEKAGNYDQAIAVLQPAAEQNPTQDLLWGYLGDAYRGAKKYPEAIDAYQKAVQLKPH